MNTMHIAEQKEGKGLLTNAIKCERLVPKIAATPRYWCGRGSLTCCIHRELHQVLVLETRRGKLGNESSPSNLLAADA